MRRPIGISLVLVFLLLAVPAVSAITDFVVVGNTSSVKENEILAPGQTATAYAFLGFHEDYITHQNVTFTTDLENPVWNYSVYIKEPNTYSVEWYPQPVVSGKTLVIPSTENVSAFYDAVKVTVTGKVPSGKNGPDLVLEKAVWYDTKTGDSLGTFVIDGTGTGTRYGQGVSVPTSQPTTQKSPVGCLLGITSLFIGLTCIIARDRQRK